MTYSIKKQNGYTYVLSMIELSKLVEQGQVLKGGFHPIFVDIILKNGVSQEIVLKQMGLFTIHLNFIYNKGVK